MNYLYREIETIRQKPAMYFDKKSITAMSYHLGGFMAAMQKFGKEDVPKKLLPLPFVFFNEYVSNHYYGNQSALGWCNIILRENSFNEDKSLDVFFDLFSKFTSMSIRHCRYTKLSEKAIAFHNANENVPTIAFPPEYKPEPLYKNPMEVYLIELTDTGFISMINTNSQHRIARRIYRIENEAMNHLNQCFDYELNWDDARIDNYDFYNEFSMV